MERILSAFRGAIRLTLTFVLMASAVLLILLTGWMGITYRRIRLANWIIFGLARMVMPVLGVRVRCDAPKQLWAHEGFIIGNHQSLMDVAVLVYLAPARFLSAAENRRYFMIGYLAEAVETIFVDRGNLRSRREALLSLGEASRYPPIAVFPEGRINTDSEMLKFFSGVFRVAATSEIPLQPFVIHYSRHDLLSWRDRAIFPELWKMSARKGPIDVTVRVLEPIHPTPDENPVALARTTRQHMMGAFSAIQNPQPETE